MASYKQHVIKIEDKQGDQGPYKMVSFQKKDGTVKVRKLWGELAAPFTQIGAYQCSFDDETHYLTGAKWLENSSDNPVNGHNSFGKSAIYDDKTARAIRSQTAMKATAAILAGRAFPDSTAIVEAIPKVMRAFVDAAEQMEIATPKEQEADS